MHLTLMSSYEINFQILHIKNEWNLPSLSLVLFFFNHFEFWTMWKRWSILNHFYFQAVSSLSFYNGVVHVVINAVILGFCILHIGTWGWTKVSFGIDILSFPIALGVIVFSYTSQIFLPTLEGNMLDKSKFHCMLNWSHIAAAIFKAGFGYVGFLTFQEGIFGIFICMLIVRLLYDCIINQAMRAWF